MRIDPDIKLDYKDVLIRPKRSTISSRSEVQLERTFIFKNCNHPDNKTWTGVPVVASNMDTIGNIETADVMCRQKLVTVLSKHLEGDKILRFVQADPSRKRYLFLSSGISEADLDRLDQLVRLTGVKQICLDVANGYSEIFVTTCKVVRDRYPDCVLMAGNVVTGEMTEQLVLNGVDIVKVGIGPGSVCTTRKMTGVGYPQLSAVIECADAAHGLGGLIVADGGCTCPGDVVKAFGAGADFVMLGGMLSGHDESSGEVITDGEGNKKKLFYGMSSDIAVNKYSGGLSDYRAAEGKVVEVVYRGPLANTLQEILGGIRSACAYVGAVTLKELSKRTTFVRVTQQLNNIFS